MIKLICNEYNMGGRYTLKKLGFILLGTIILLTGCGKENNVVNEKDKLSVYELHYYDKDFKHTEDFIVKYDKNGNFKELEMFYLYDERTDSKYCPENLYNTEDYVDLTYPGVSASCTISEKGQLLTAKMTDESVKNGYLKDDKDFMLMLKYAYDELDTEEKAKSYFEKALENFKKENVLEDERNYVIIKGQKTSW